ncbi:hypothetical protein TWF481_012032 [Arthrobotrys musiformis]|uniref:Transmembrane protein n=1 Tax=Arthrobotrys musiformis TaxID=47236 RepID=A0AAV9VWY5_9PEZI
MSGPSKDPETASQQGANSWTLSFDSIVPEGPELELQAPRPTLPPPGPPNFTSVLPALMPELPHTTPSEVDMPSEIIAFPEPAASIVSLRGTTAESIRSIRPGSALYYCRYSEDGDRSEMGSQEGTEARGIEGYRVFREKDLAGSSKANPLSPYIESSHQGSGSEDGRNSQGGSSPTRTITPGNGSAGAIFSRKEAMESTGTVIRYPRRVSVFTENISSDSSEVEYQPSIVLEEKTETTKYIPSSDRFLYIHAPWILRFIYVFIFANWWSLIPLMKVSSSGFHPENLPIFYSSAMLAIVIINIVLQLNFLRLYGAPWGHRRRAEKIRDVDELQETNEHPDSSPRVYDGSHGTDSNPGVIDLESNRNASRATLRKDKNRRKWRMRTGMECYVFVVDIILFMLTLAVLGVSVVFARHGSAMHQLQMDAAANATSLAVSGQGGTGGLGPNGMVQLYGNDDGYNH